jgi:site-specific DNA-methyltransferase (cytosine-N4-specific)
LTGEIYVGDVRDGLRKFIADRVRARTCVTSPPYWGLRDYGVAGQLGLEPTPGEFLAAMVDVFRLVRDVLADDGTLWLNMGDSYSSGGRGGNPGGDSSTLEGSRESQEASMVKRYPRRPPQTGVVNGVWQRSGTDGGARIVVDELGPKQLIGMPWRLALALQADGWWLRQDIIWAKPNPMPESIRDRCTKAHEYLFLLAKRERYYFDGRAIREQSIATNPHDHTGGAVCGLVPGARPQSGTRKSKKPDGWATHGGGHGSFHRDGREAGEASVIDYTRNKRSVWTIATESFKDAHFATFPTALVEPCIAAGSAPGDIVLDPFMGSGTVAEVAQRMGRRWIGCELNPQYAAMIERRSAQRGIEFPATASAAE